MGSLGCVHGTTSTTTTSTTTTSTTTTTTTGACIASAAECWNSSGPVGSATCCGTGGGENSPCPFQPHEPHNQLSLICVLASDWSILQAAILTNHKSSYINL